MRAQADSEQQQRKKREARLLQAARGPPRVDLQACPSAQFHSARWNAETVFRNDAQGLTGILIGRLLIKGRFEAARLATDSP